MVGLAGDSLRPFNLGDAGSMALSSPGIAARRKATFIGAITLLLWAALGLLTTMLGPVPPLQLVAMTFHIGGLSYATPSMSALLLIAAGRSGLTSAIAIACCAIVGGAVLAARDLWAPDRAPSAAEATP
jgi:hypothetical protein